jgi:hypothetical protein
MLTVLPVISHLTEIDRPQLRFPVAETQALFQRIALDWATQAADLVATTFTTGQRIVLQNRGANAPLNFRPTQTALGQAPASSQLVTHGQAKVRLNFPPGEPANVREYRLVQQRRRTTCSPTGAVTFIASRVTSGSSATITRGRNPAADKGHPIFPRIGRNLNATISRVSAASRCNDSKIPSAAAERRGAEAAAGVGVAVVVADRAGAAEAGAARKEFRKLTQPESIYEN